MNLGFIVLAHQDLDRVAQLVRHLADAGCPVAVHIDRHVPQAGFAALQREMQDLPQVRFAPRIQCEWGRFSLVKATLGAARTLLDAAPDLDHVCLISGSCLPIRPIKQFKRFLSRNRRVDFIESVSVENNFWVKDGLNEERFTLYFPFSWRNQRRLFDRAVSFQRRVGVRRRIPGDLVPHIGSQWWCLTARTLRAILDDPRRPYFDSYFSWSWIPDESYFQTLARLHGEKIESRSLTFSKFDYLGRPFTLYDDHLEDLQLSDCFMARKVWRGADRLYARYLDPARANQPMSKADPKAFEAMFDRADQLRCEGGTGRFHQGRFPYDKAERTGVSNAPYTVFVGFQMLYNHFPRWVETTTDTLAHGSVFARGHVAHRPSTDHFEGNLAAAIRIRNRNPKGYLANLLWPNRHRHQSLLLDFRDHTAILDTLVCDPRATVVLVRHSWLIRLLQQKSSFEGILANARRYLRMEQIFLEAFAGPDACARLTTLPLEFALEQPAAFLEAAVGHMPRGSRALKSMPGHVTVDGLDHLVRKLRNTGLKLEYEPQPKPRTEPAAKYQKPYVVK